MLLAGDIGTTTHCYERSHKEPSLGSSVKVKAALLLRCNAALQSVVDVVEMKIMTSLQSMKSGDTRLPHLSLGKEARGREFQKHSSAAATGWMKLRLVIFFAMFVPLGGWPQDDDEYLPVNSLKGATLTQPQGEAKGGKSQHLTLSEALL